MDTRIDTGTKEPYWKVKDTVENLFFNQKFPTLFEARQFANLENAGWYPPRYIAIRFTPKGKGWHESPGRDGKAPIHKEVATRAQAKGAQNIPMKKAKEGKRIPNWEKSFSSDVLTEYTHKDGQVFVQVKTLPPNNWTAELWRHIDGGEETEMFHVINNTKTKSSATRQAENWMKKNPNPSMKKQGHFVIGEDNMGSITLSHSHSKKEAFFQFESDTDAVKDLLTKTEKDELENGYTVEIPNREPRASVLQEMFEASVGD